MANIDQLQIIEAILAQHQAFGRSDYINGQLQVVYTRRLATIATLLPGAAQLLNALNRADSYSRYRVIGDTVVRCAIQHALKQIVTGNQYGFPLDQCDEVFCATTLLLKEGHSDGPLQAGVARVNRLGPAPWHSWIWSDDHSDDIFGRSFRYVVQENYCDCLCTPTSDELAILVKGAHLLGELLPSLSRNSLGHAHMVALFPAVDCWVGKASSSQFRVSGTIFLNRDALQSPWWIAEHLFHESLHQKLYDFRHGHSLLMQDSVLDQNYLGEDEDILRVWSPWNMPGSDRANYWDTHRVMAAFHVYVHLALLCTLAEQRAPELEKSYGPLQGPITMTASCKAFERAHYLGEKLKELCWQELGPAGKLLTEWLISVLGVLDPAPPPEGAYIHLLLDRYLTEATRVEYALKAINADSVKRESTTTALSKLISEEIASTKRVLVALNAQDDLARFNKELAQYIAEGVKSAFPQVRRLIATTIMGVFVNGYELLGPACEELIPNEFVTKMVEDSSQHLEVLLK